MPLGDTRAPGPADSFTPRACTLRNAAVLARIPVVPICGNTEGQLFPWDILEEVIDVRPHPFDACNGTRRRAPSILAVGHERNEIASRRQRGKVVPGAPAVL